MGRPVDHASLRQLPKVGALLSSPDIAPLVQTYGRTLVTEAVRRAIEQNRQRILRGEEAGELSLRDVVREAEILSTRSLRRVLNATGVILHTNLGRAPLPRPAREAVSEVAEGYSTVEFDLGQGTRGSRHAHVEPLIKELLGSEAGLAVNNCAGAVLLMLAALARGREVIVARGELVEIGGGFRVPDVMRESGAKLIEVGTTNKVYARDYVAAVSPDTAAILVVHRSNFALVGFTAQPEITELAGVAGEHGLLLLADLGSGLLADEQQLGPLAKHLSGEPSPRAFLEAGSDVVAFSGDKLLGGPQAGILAGKQSSMDRIRRHPLARALRTDKLSLAALEATLRLYRDQRLDEIPALRAMQRGAQELRATAEELARRISELRPSLRVEVVEDESVVGGGSLPLARMPTSAVLLGEPGEHGRRLMEALRGGTTPVIARVIEDRTALDTRTIEPEQLPTLAHLVVEADSALEGV